MREWTKNPVVEIKMLKGEAGGSTWGNVNGDISNQSDLMAILNSKMDNFDVITDEDIDDIVG